MPPRLRLEAAQRLAISRARQNSDGMTEATAPDMPQSIKMGQTEDIGCMAVLGGIDVIRKPYREHKLA
jgi:hypothetical protein